MSLFIYAWFTVKWPKPLCIASYWLFEYFQSFTYGGRGGNSNNFQDVFECERICANGSHQGTILPRRCKRCSNPLAQVVCAVDFIIVAEIQHFDPERFKKTGSSYLHVAVKEVLLDRLNLNLQRRHRSSPAMNMGIKLSLDAKCPCPRITDIHPGVRSVASRHHRSGRSSEILAIIAGSMVDGIPTLTSKGFVQGNTTFYYTRVVNLAKFQSLCSELSRLGG